MHGGTNIESTLKLGSVYLDRDTKLVSNIKKARDQAGKLRSISRPRCRPITYIVYKLKKTDLVFKKKITTKKVFKIQRYRQYGALYLALRKILPVCMTIHVPDNTWCLIYIFNDGPLIR